MKWEKPTAKLEKFVANEYIAGCMNIACDVPGEGEYDPFDTAHKDRNNLHRAQFCGSASANLISTDDNGIPFALTHTKAGSTGGRPLACAVFADASYTTPRDISTIQPGDFIYWTTVNGKTWHHHGTVGPLTNHS